MSVCLYSVVYCVCGFIVMPHLCQGVSMDLSAACVLDKVDIFLI